MNHNYVWFMIESCMQFFCAIFVVVPIVLIFVSWHGRRKCLEFFCHPPPYINKKRSVLLSDRHHHNGGKQTSPFPLKKVSLFLHRWISGREPVTPIWTTPYSPLLKQIFKKFISSQISASSLGRRVISSRWRCGNGSPNCCWNNGF